MWLFAPSRVLKTIKNSSKCYYFKWMQNWVHKIPNYSKMFAFWLYPIYFYFLCSNVFRLHYKATLVIFVVSSLLVTSRQYIGDPIDCIVDGVPGSDTINNVNQMSPFLDIYYRSIRKYIKYLILIHVELKFINVFP